MVQEFIGQNKAKLLISEWKSRDSFPHFMLIVGEEGSGRKTISRLISKELDCHLELRTDLSAGSVRQLIDIAYRTMSKILYVIPNADTMSIQAKNLFLKFTEEPPENAYIILTLNSLDNTLPTLISRSQQIVLEPYTRQELAALTENKKYASIATTPGMLQYFEELGEETVANIVDFCRRIITKIDKVSFSNAFKSSQKIDFKSSRNQMLTKIRQAKMSKDKNKLPTQYELSSFLASMQYALDRYVRTDPDDKMLIRLSCWYHILPKYHYLLNKAGLNKKAIYDKLILESREELIKRGA